MYFARNHSQLASGNLAWLHSILMVVTTWPHDHTFGNDHAFGCDHMCGHTVWLWPHVWPWPWVIPTWDEWEVLLVTLVPINSWIVNISVVHLWNPLSMREKERLSTSLGWFIHLSSLVPRLHRRGARLHLSVFEVALSFAKLYSYQRRLEASS